MLDRAVVKQFLHDELEEAEIEVPGDIDRDSLVETFSQYVEEDYYEWLKDNFRAFFGHEELDWDQIRERVGHADRGSFNKGQGEGGLRDDS